MLGGVTVAPSPVGRLSYDCPPAATAGHVAAIRAVQLGKPSPWWRRSAGAACVSTGVRRHDGDLPVLCERQGARNGRNRRIREGGRRRHARRVLGDHMIGGPEVTELLPALTLAKQWDLTADEVARNVFAHPTLLEAMKETVEGIAGHMISFDHRMTWPEPGTQRQADADPARKRSSPSSSGTRPSHPLLGVRATEATGLARGRLPRLGSIHRGSYERPAQPCPHRCAVLKDSGPRFLIVGRG